uniref:Uncharacterized protein n=1 Tax=Opuntia streptacantha TaxID=393608 RepID=A0A7C9DX22_OPUST
MLRTEQNRSAHLCTESWVARTILHSQSTTSPPSTLGVKGSAPIHIHKRIFAFASTQTSLNLPARVQVSWIWVWTASPPQTFWDLSNQGRILRDLGVSIE